MPNEENKGSRRKNGRARARRRKELEEDEEVELNGYRGKGKREEASSTFNSLRSFHYLYLLLWGQDPPWT